MLDGCGVSVGVEVAGGLAPGSVVLEPVATGPGGGCEGGALVFVLIGAGLGVRVAVGERVHVGQTVAGVDEGAGVLLTVAVAAGV